MLMNRSFDVVNHSVLLNAKAKRRDEFYTLLSTVEKEMEYHRDFLVGKSVYCNCDRADDSAFWSYFRDNFDSLGLERLISTGFSAVDKGTLGIIERVGGTSVEHISKLKGDGDFASDECVSFLMESDAIVTNPPFSLLGQYLELMYELERKFCVIGNQNAFTFRGMHEHLSDGTLRLGHSIHGGGTWFRVPDWYPITSKNNFHIDESGNKFISVTGVRWLTNFDDAYVPEHMELRTIEENLADSKFASKLKKRFGDAKYFAYDNRPDAIEVPVTKCAPLDYDGVMGLPVTFMDKYRPDDWSIIGFRKGYDGRDLRVQGKDMYFRILVRRKAA